MIIYVGGVRHHWWLIDETRVIRLHFNPDGVLNRITLTDDQDQVAEALQQRAIALRISG